jgi:hypothetical protein
MKNLRNLAAALLLFCLYCLAINGAESSAAFSAGSDTGKSAGSEKVKGCGDNAKFAWQRQETSSFVSNGADTNAPSYTITPWYSFFTGYSNSFFYKNKNALSAFALFSLPKGLSCTDIIFPFHYFW